MCKKIFKLELLVETLFEFKLFIIVLLKVTTKTIMVFGNEIINKKSARIQYFFTCDEVDILVFTLI